MFQDYLLIVKNCRPQRMTPTIITIAAIRMRILKNATKKGIPKSLLWKKTNWYTNRYIVFLQMRATETSEYAVHVAHPPVNEHNWHFSGLLYKLKFREFSCQHFSFKIVPRIFRWIQIRELRWLWERAYFANVLDLVLTMRNLCYRLDR